MIPRYNILTRDVANSIIEGYIFIYSCSAKFVSFQNDCFVCEHKYMSMLQIIEFATPLILSKAVRNYG